MKLFNGDRRIFFWSSQKALKTTFKVQVQFKVTVSLGLRLLWDSIWDSVVQPAQIHVNQFKKIKIGFYIREYNDSLQYSHHNSLNTMKNVRREEDFALPCKFIAPGKQVEVFWNKSPTDNTLMAATQPSFPRSHCIPRASYPGSSLFLIETRSQSLGSCIQINK